MIKKAYKCSIRKGLILKIEINKKVLDKEIKMEIYLKEPLTDTKVFLYNNI